MARFDPGTSQEGFTPHNFAVIDKAAFGSALFLLHIAYQPFHNFSWERHGERARERERERERDGRSSGS